jgi:hypothetical protein
VWLRTLLAAAVAVALSGCSSEPITQTPFQRVAADAASTLSAAAYTIQFIHDQPARLTVEYGQASMINYLELVAAVPEELTTLPGAPDGAAVNNLTTLVQAAIGDLENACLLPDCDWQVQIRRMTDASQALAQAAE